MSSKPPKNVTQTTSTEPPGYLQPFLKDAAQQARGIYQGAGPDFYPGQMTVGFSPESGEALGMQANRARMGSDVTRASQGQLTDTLRGNYLYGNPGFNAAVKASTDYTIPQVQSKFAGSGRSRGGLAQEAVGRTISNAFASQYGQERDNMIKANAFAPMAAQQDYQDIDMLRGVGREVEGKAQDYLSEDIARYDYYQNLPERKLGTYINFLNNAYPGSQGSASQPLYRNRASGAAGGAIGGAQAGSSFGGWGTLIGAIAGGLLGGQ